MISADCFSHYISALQHRLVWVQSPQTPGDKQVHTAKKKRKNKTNRFMNTHTHTQSYLNTQKFHKQHTTKLLLEQIAKKKNS